MIYFLTVFTITFVGTLTLAFILDTLMKKIKQQTS